MRPRFLPAVLLLVATSGETSGPAGLHDALARLERAGQFSGAVVIRDANGVRFARAYGLADPFAGRPFSVDTPVDSGSLAKPVTAAAVLALADDGRIALDAPAKRYVEEFPFDQITVRQLLSHSAGLSVEDSPDALAGKSNLQLVQSARGRPLLFPPGTAFTYCNLCTVALAELVERVSKRHYLDFARARLGLPAGVGLRPASLAEWHGRAIGYRRKPDGKIERFDSWEGERFYGAANLSISASQLADWGSRWWRPPLSSLDPSATTDARIGGRTSGLTLGNWYCSADKRKCHYLGHHEGFHHMLYRDVGSKLSVAMVSNNRLSPGLIPRLQRALVAFAEGQRRAGRQELDRPLTGTSPERGNYRLTSGETVAIAGSKERLALNWRGFAYPAYAVDPAIHYIPGLDAYLAGDGPKAIRLITMQHDVVGRRP